ncbi:MAG TPA: ADP-ribosylglycohydrolase family protein [Niastella sp.]
MSKSTLLQQQFESCILGGAIGDAWGSSYENQPMQNNTTTFYLGQKKEPVRTWSFTDDTQLTMATCESLCTDGVFNPTLLADNFVRYYREKRLTGIGASTLKAIIELQAGGHWSQVGRSGEYAAGNGAAMRMAPFAFFKNITRENIRDACRITHKNDEAYTGAQAIVISLKAIITGTWTGENNLFDLIIPELPDTRVRDRLIEINAINNQADIKTIAQLGNDGYVVNSVPFAIYAANKVLQTGLSEMFNCIIETGGDTDTNASLAGQIAGTLIGKENFPPDLIAKLETVENYSWVRDIIENTKDYID